MTKCSACGGSMLERVGTGEGGDLPLGERYLECARCEAVVREEGEGPTACAHCGEVDGTARTRPGLVGDEPTCDACERSIRAESGCGCCPAEERGACGWCGLPLEAVNPEQGEAACTCDMEEGQ